jgi:hypothetical protein
MTLTAALLVAAASASAASAGEIGSDRGLTLTAVQSNAERFEVRQPAIGDQAYAAAPNGYVVDIGDWGPPPRKTGVSGGND